MNASLLSLSIRLLAWLSLLTLALSAGVLQDGEPGPYSSRLDGSLQDRMLDMATDSKGNVYIIGSFSSDEMAVETYRDDNATTTGAVVIKERNILRTAGGEDVFVAKYDASGKLLWVQSAGGTGNDYGTGVAVDDKGNVFITGSYSGTAVIGGTTLDTSLRTANAGEGKVTAVNLT